MTTKEFSAHHMQAMAIAVAHFQQVYVLFEASDNPDEPTMVPIMLAIGRHPKHTWIHTPIPFPISPSQEADKKAARSIGREVAKAMTKDGATFEAVFFTTEAFASEAREEHSVNNEGALESAIVRKPDTRREIVSVVGASTRGDYMSGIFPVTRTEESITLGDPEVSKLGLHAPLLKAFMEGATWKREIS